MRTKKPLLLIAVITIMISFLLTATGCKEKLPEGKTVKITMGLWPQSSNTQDLAQFERWIELYSVDHPEVLIEPYPYEYSPNSFTALAESGEAPTIFKTWFTEPQKLIAAGYVKDIKFIYEEQGWTDYLNPTIKDILSDENGGIYGVPCDGYALGLFMNMDYMRAIGLTEEKAVTTEYGTVTTEVAKYPTSLYNPNDPRDLTTLTGVAIAIKEEVEVPGMLILSDAGNGGWQFSNIVWNFGGELQKVNKETGKIEANLNSDEAVAALEWIKALKHEYKVLPDATKLPYNAWSSYFGTGNVGMCFAGNDAVELPITAYGMDKEKISIAPMPAGPNGRYALYGGSPFMISSSASDDEARAAIDFLHYMGRFPVDDSITRYSYTQGNQTAISKGMPILPRLAVWTNDEYKTAFNEELAKFINNKEYARYSDFYGVSENILRKEEPYYCQEMYTILDTVIQKVLSDSKADCRALLTEANNQFTQSFLK